MVMPKVFKYITETEINHSYEQAMKIYILVTKIIYGNVYLMDQTINGI